MRKALPFVLGAAVSAMVVVGTSAAEVEKASYAQQAKQILDATGTQGGLIVHLGCGDGKLTVKGNNIKFSGQLSESSSSGSVETKEFSKTDTWRVVAASGEKIRLGVPGRDGKEKQGDILKLGKDRAALLLNGRRIIFDRK